MMRFIAFQHGARYLRGRRPNTAQRSGAALVFGECFKVGLNRFVPIQKDNANGVAWNAVDELLRVFNHAPDTPMKVRNVNGAIRRQNAKFLRRKPAVPRNVGEHLFGGLSGKAPHRGAYDRSERQNAFMDGYEINDVARFAAVGGGRRFVVCWACSAA